MKVSRDFVKRLALQGLSSEEILNLCYEGGYRPNDEEVSIWDTFMRKKGLNDDSALVQEEKESIVFGDKAEIKTLFEFYEYGEKRKT